MKRTLHTFRGKRTTIKEFAGEIGLPVYLISIMLHNSFTMDQIFINRAFYEEDGTFQRWKQEFNRLKSPDKMRASHSFCGRPTTVYAFCKETGHPYLLVRLMLEEGINMDEINSEWDKWEADGTIRDWREKERARRTSDPFQQSAPEPIDISEFLANPSKKKAEFYSEKDRIKKIMSVPVNPKYTTYYYFMKDFRHRAENSYDLK